MIFSKIFIAMFRFCAFVGLVKLQQLHPTTDLSLLNIYSLLWHYDTQLNDWSDAQRPSYWQKKRINFQLMTQSAEAGILLEWQADLRGSGGCYRAANNFPIALLGGRWEVWCFSTPWSHQWQRELRAKRLLWVPLSVHVCETIWSTGFASKVLS